MPMKAKAVIKIVVVSGTKERKKSSSSIKRCSLVVVLLDSMTYAIRIHKCVYSLVDHTVVILGNR